MTEVPWDVAGAAGAWEVKRAQAPTQAHVNVRESDLIYWELLSS